MTTILLQRFAVISGLMVIMIGCTPETAPENAGQEAASLSQDAGPQSEVIVALEAAARGEPFKDDLHPETEKSGKPMSPIQRAFDVKRYVLSIRVMPATQSIEGTVDVTFEALEPLDAIELDLDPKLEIRGATSGDVPLVVTRNEDTFKVDLAARLDAGARSMVSISYGGKPHVAPAPPWYGGFVWSEVDGTPWFATAVQTEGCDLWWPCKDTYADKPDEGVEVAIAAPRGVKVASVGLLAGVDEGDDGFDTWRWTSRHPYTGYAIAINGGPYELVERDYLGVNGTTYPIQFWALPKNADKAARLIETDAVPDLEFFERMIGPYPWGDEKVGFVETPHLGMEHQTINAYGDQYQRGEYGFDELMHHELAHEWFGNVMTHTRPEDSWLHEGYASYMQAVYAEETVGKMGYFARMHGGYQVTSHCMPVANADVDDVGEAFDNRDIYTKGAWTLHTLRNFIGEEAFWAGTRRLIYGIAEPWSLAYPIQSRFRTTEEFIRIMSEEAGQDVAWLVETYLRETGMPKLITSRGNGRLVLEWSVPGGRPFPMPVTVNVDGEDIVVEMSAEGGSLAVHDSARLLIDPDSETLRDLGTIGDCAEQTTSKINRNIERFTRMAKDYGWRRN
jgi:aminopeptidase N